MNLGLTGDSCAIPTHVWASLGGSQPFLGSSLAVGIAAGLCNPDLVRADDTQTCGTDDKMCKIRPSNDFSVSSNDKVHRPVFHLFIFSLLISLASSSADPTSEHNPHCLLFEGRKFPLLPLWFLEAPLVSSSKVILLGGASKQIRGENLGQLLCLCSASLSLQL